MSDLITAEFVRTRPHAVARELERFTLDDVVEFVNQLDDELGILVLAQVSSRVLGELLGQLSRQRISALLCAGTHRDAQAVIAHIPGEEYEAIVAAATLTDRPQVQALFGIPARTIAMQTTRRFIRVFPDETCGAVLRELSSSELEDQTPIVVTDENSRYLGMVPLLDLLHQANVGRNVEDFLNRVVPLNADASISASLSLRQWDDYPVLPVVDDDRVFVGSVAIRDLRRYRETDVQVQQPSIGLALIDAYINLCATLISLLFAGRSSR